MTRTAVATMDPPASIIVIFEREHSRGEFVVSMADPANAWAMVMAAAEVVPRDATWHTEPTTNPDPEWVAKQQRFREAFFRLARERKEQSD